MVVRIANVDGRSVDQGGIDECRPEREPSEEEHTPEIRQDDDSTVVSHGVHSRMQICGGERNPTSHRQKVTASDESKDEGYGSNNASVYEGRDSDDNLE
mmetsp:Transcript_16952/g.20156  ORF Transcript_16952/g.20156 Transcript_16952/m.20156 type:complete len:99 (+) Transcript_16952:535-831(+)